MIIRPLQKLKTLHVITIVILTSAAFIPSLFNGFVEQWDDAAYITENDFIKQLSFQNIKSFFTGEYNFGGYLPFTMLSFTIEYHFFKLKPIVYHFTNYLLHIVTTLLVFYFIYLISQNHLVAFITSFLFGIHPMHVESVAWISERKDLLCAFFYVVSLILYTMYLKHKNKKYYYFSFVSAAFSLFSKSMAVTLPVILVIVDYFYGRKLNKKTLLEKIPFFILAFAFAAVNIHLQRLNIGSSQIANFDVKIYFASRVILFYFSKLILPVNLSALYSYHHVAPEHLAQIKYNLALLSLLLIGIIYSLKHTKKVLFGSLFFIISIAPVLKLIPGGDAFAADRYMYLPSIGLFYIFAVFFVWVLKRITANFKAIRFVAIFVLSFAIILFSGLTWKRCLVWKDAKTLFRDVLEKQPTNSPVPYLIMGNFFESKKDLNRAKMYYRGSLTVQPDFDKAKEGLSRIYARAYHESAVSGDDKLDREYNTFEAELLNKLGARQGMTSNYEWAVESFREAIRLRPNRAEYYNNLGYTYYLMRDYGRAIEYFKEAIRIDPNHKSAKLNLDTVQGLLSN